MLFISNIFSIHFQALIDIVNKQQQSKGPGSSSKRTYGVPHRKPEVQLKEKESPFDSINNIVANLMLNMTR